MLMDLSIFWNKIIKKNGLQEMETIMDVRADINIINTHVLHLLEGPCSYNMDYWKRSDQWLDKCKHSLG